MVRWLRWHCPPDTGFEIRALAVWGRARYLSVTEAPHNTNFHTRMAKKQFCFFQTAETGNRTPHSGVKGSGANHYPSAPCPCAAYKSLHSRAVFDSDGSAHTGVQWDKSPNCVNNTSYIGFKIETFMGAYYSQYMQSVNTRYWSDVWYVLAITLTFGSVPLVCCRCTGFKHWD